MGAGSPENNHISSLLLTVPHVVQIREREHTVKTLQLTSVLGIVAYMVCTSLGGFVPCDPGSTQATQSVDPTTITVGGSVACTTGSGTPAHQYGRSYDLSTLGMSGDIDITCVHWGIEASDVELNCTVSIFIDTDGDPAPGSSAGDLTLVSSAMVTEPGTITPHWLSVNLSAATVSSSDRILVVLDIPASAGFPLAGANNAGELSPSYLRTLNGDCGIVNWSTTAGIGFPSSHWVQSIEVMAAGPADPCDEALPDCPTDLTGPAGSPDNTTDVNDVLHVIGGFGQTGDGTFRPDGDVFPLPNGDCATTVDDLLDVIAAFGNDCVAQPTGAHYRQDRRGSATSTASASTNRYLLTIEPNSVWGYQKDPVPLVFLFLMALCIFLKGTGIMCKLGSKKRVATTQPWFIVLVKNISKLLVL